MRERDFAGTAKQVLEKKNIFFSQENNLPYGRNSGRYIISVPIICYIYQRTFQSADALQSTVVK